MPLTLPNLPFSVLTTSKQLISGARANAIAALLASGQTLTALPGGGFAGAPTINAAYVDLTVVATANDSVALPVAKQGLQINITNDGVASANIFPQPTDIINAQGAGTSVALAVGANAWFYCNKNGFWRRFVSA